MGKRAAWIFLIAFALRSLLPPGFMLAPGASEDHVFQVVVCSSQGTKLVTVDQFGQPVEPDDTRVSESITCAYGPPPLTMTGALSIDPMTERRVERIAHDRARAFQLRHRPLATHYARGPPTSLSI